MAMREIHGQDVQADTGSGADAPERYAGGSRRPDHAAVQDAESRAAYALAYREHVAVEYAAHDRADAVPLSDEGGRSLATKGTESDRASSPAEHSVGSRDVDHGGDQAQREGKSGRATQDVTLPPSTKDLPDARDVVPNIEMAEFDGRKLSDYSLNPEHP